MQSRFIICMKWGFNIAFKFGRQVWRNILGFRILRTLLKGVAKNSKLEEAKVLTLVVTKRFPVIWFFPAMHNKVGMELCVQDVDKGFAQIWLLSCEVRPF